MCKFSLSKSQVLIILTAIAGLLFTALIYRNLQTNKQSNSSTIVPTVTPAPSPTQKPTPIVSPKPTSTPTRKPTPTLTPAPTSVPTPTTIPIPTLNARVGEEFTFSIPFNTTEGVESKPYYNSSFLQFYSGQLEDPSQTDTYETWRFKALRAGETELVISRYRMPSRQEVRRFTYKVIISQ